MCVLQQQGKFQLCMCHRTHSVRNYGKEGLQATAGKKNGCGKMLSHKALCNLVKENAALSD